MTFVYKIIFFAIAVVLLWINGWGLYLADNAWQNQMANAPLIAIIIWIALPMIDVPSLFLLRWLYKKAGK